MVDFAPQQIHHQAGRNFAADLFYPCYDQGSELLSKEEGSHKDQVAIPCKAQMKAKPHPDNK